MARQWILLTALVCLTLHGSLTGGQGGYSYLDGPSFKVDLAPGSYDGVYDREDEGRIGGGYQCYKPPESYKYNISELSYFYPRDDIYLELHERKDVLEQIFKDGVPATSPATEKDILHNILDKDLQSNVGEAVSVDPVGGCIGYTLLLRSFDAYGGHCWLVYPLHQAIRFVSCGHSQCKGHNAYAGYRPCIPEDVPREMWVYCDVLEPGRRIVKTTIPVPVSCKCLAYDC
ncbi:uncharacterized protein LOC112559946 [Pomacea canaliculata]|uniref:uncharacterized protein LOC112559946 n=1 Tax=Pomacea canaliculata TaxID=400727 RepID=UPI000D73E487|nr:uncharacterized protein LOC112559946 [Pomacea canaliculata]